MSEFHLVECQVRPLRCGQSQEGNLLRHKRKNINHHEDREDTHCVYKHSRSVDREQVAVSCTGSTGLASGATSEQTLTQAELVYLAEMKKTCLKLRAINVEKL